MKWFKLIEEERGDYQDKNGKTFILIQCHKAMDKDGKKNAELGLVQFNSLEDCLKEWGLTRIERKK